MLKISGLVFDRRTYRERERGQHSCSVAAVGDG